MALIKNPEDLRKLRQSGKRLSAVLRAVVKEVKPGVSAKYLDDLAERLIREGGDEPAFLNYRPRGASRPYPATLNVSINDEVVHGIPNEKEKILKDGDIVLLDTGLYHEGIYTDMAVTVPVGNADKEALRLIEITKNALMAGIKAAVMGGRINDIGCAMEPVVRKAGFSIVPELCGHGVGYAQHEAPEVPSFCMKGKSPALKDGMVIAIEPIVNEGGPHIYLMDDGYTYKTADGKRSAEFEHTILITENGPEIITA
ncbi:MAG: type I methionyl aminopeptidase [Patescibacteria group bacterium]